MLSYPDQIYEFLRQNIDILGKNWDILLVVIVGELIVVALVGTLAWAYNRRQRRKERPQISIKWIFDKPGVRIGFSVQTKNRTLTDAKVRCNNISYSWEEGNNQIEKKDLFVGDPPSVFYPFLLRFDIDKEKSSAENLVVFVAIEEVVNKKNIFAETFNIPKDPTTGRFTPSERFKVEITLTIRIIAHQIEEVRDISVKIAQDSLLTGDLTVTRVPSDEN